MAARCDVCDYHLESEGPGFVCLNCAREELKKLVRQCDRLSNQIAEFGGVVSNETVDAFDREIEAAKLVLRGQQPSWAPK